MPLCSCNYVLEENMEARVGSCGMYSGRLNGVLSVSLSLVPFACFLGQCPFSLLRNKKRGIQRRMKRAKIEVNSIRQGVGQKRDKENTVQRVKAEV